MMNSAFEDTYELLIINDRHYLTKLIVEYISYDESSDARQL
jgi:hypothetical protein